MSVPLASVFTPSYNKGTFAAEAVASVLGQDCGDFEYWIIENSADDVTREVLAPLLGDPRIRYAELSFTAPERAGRYIPSVLLNEYYPKAAGEFIFYLSDDDILMPSCISRCTAFLNEDPARMVCYFTQQQESWRENAFHPHGGIPAHVNMGAGTPFGVVDSRIDGGQIAFRREALDGISQPWFTENPDPSVACHSDGVFMQRLADLHTFHAIPDHLGTKRRTPVSTWGRSG
jgi:spore maturation protein CgeD